MIPQDSKVPHHFILLNSQTFREDYQEPDETFSNNGFPADSLFVPLYAIDEKEDNKNTTLNKDAVKSISEKLNLVYLPFNDSRGEVCFLDNEEVRPEFRLSFSPTDIFDYISGYLACPEYSEKYKELRYQGFPFVPFPENDIEFWKFANTGS